VGKTFQGEQGLPIRQNLNENLLLQKFRRRRQRSRKDGKRGEGDEEGEKVCGGIRGQQSKREEEGRPYKISMKNSNDFKRKASKEDEMGGTGWSSKFARNAQKNHSEQLKKGEFYGDVKRERQMGGGEKRNEEKDKEKIR